MIKSIEERLVMLYLMFCMPRIIINTATGEAEFSYYWTDDKAKQVYDDLQDYLIELKRLSSQKHGSLAGFEAGR